MFLHDEEEEIIQITSKGAREIGLMIVKSMLKELDLTKLRLLSIRSLVKKIDQDNADQILMFAAQALGPTIEPMTRELIKLNDGFLEPMRKGLVEKKIKTWQDAVALFEKENRVASQENLALNTQEDQ